MSPRTLAVVILALVFGMLSAFSVYQLAIRPPEVRQAEMVSVFVVKENVDAGTVLDDTHVVQREFPKDRLPPHSITKAEDFRDRLVKVSLLQDEPVDLRKLGQPGERSLTTMFEPGEWAYTCSVADSAALGSGFILPQSFVDVMVSLKAKASREEDAEGVTSVLLQRVQVLAIGSAIAPPKGSNMEDAKSRLRTVTMRVRPEQAALLQQGSSMGVLHLVLRHWTDKTIYDVPTVGERDVRKPGSSDPIDFKDPTEQERFEQKLALVTKELRDEIEKLKTESKVGCKPVDEGRDFTIIRGSSRSSGRVVHPVDYPETKTGPAKSILAD